MRDRVTAAWYFFLTRNETQDKLKSTAGGKSNGGQANRPPRTVTEAASKDKQQSQRQQDMHEHISKLEHEVVLLDRSLKFGACLVRKEMFMKSEVVVGVPPQHTEAKILAAVVRKG